MGISMFTAQEKTGIGVILTGVLLMAIGFAAMDGRVALWDFSVSDAFNLIFRGLALVACGSALAVWDALKSNPPRVWQLLLWLAVFTGLAISMYQDWSILLAEGPWSGIRGSGVVVWIEPILVLGSGFMLIKRINALRRHRLNRRQTNRA